MKPYTTYRRTLAWIGFLTCLAAVAGILYALSWLFYATDTGARTEAFYQQTASSTVLGAVQTASSTAP